MSQDNILNKKARKQQQNLGLRLNNDELKPDNESYERLKKLFAKTQQMKGESIDNDADVEQQFKDLRQRLDKSSGFLQKVKKSIDNLKFSYQRSITDLEVVTEKNRVDVERQIEDIRRNIGNLRSRKQEPKTSKSQHYQDAFDDVLDSFERASAGCSITK